MKGKPLLRFPSTVTFTSPDVAPAGTEIKTMFWVHPVAVADTAVPGEPFT
jgi:hypothetical protein